MKKQMITKRILYFLILLSLCLFLGACAGNGEIKDSETEDSQDQDQGQTSLFSVVEHDVQTESLVLYSHRDGLEHYYEYSSSTQFMDKYGNFCPAAEFTSGRVVTIGTKNQEGKLRSLQISDEVWVYENVKKFSIDEEKGIFTIADSKYSIQDRVLLLSNGEKIYFSDLTKDDTLTVIGQEKKILSIVVTTGHGKLSLQNTGLFEDSFLQLNNDIFVIVTEDMELELPEGVYTLKVANDGWGGVTEIEIKRGETTKVDLDTLKGEGRKTGIVNFQINVDYVKVYVDYKLIDHTKPLEITYGTHILEIKADGYADWKKRLSVNTEKATLVIELEEEDKNSESTENSEDTENSESTENAQSTENSQTSERSENTEVPQNTERIENTEIPQNTEHSENTEVPQNTERLENTEVPQNTENMENTQDTEVPAGAGGTP